MKNKKLFAILTLVCFMFTLMPVAAFASVEAEATLGANSAYTNANVNVKVTSNATSTSFYAYAQNSDGELYTALDANGEYRGVAPVAAGNTGINVKFPDADTYEMFVIAVATNSGLDKIIKGETYVAMDAYVEALADADEVDFTNNKTTVRVKADENAYDISFGEAFGVAAGSINVDSDNGFSGTGEVVVTLKYANGEPVKYADIEFTTNSGYVTVEKLDAQTLKNGTMEIKITASKADTYKVFAKYGDVKETLTVVAGKADVAGVTVVAEPKTPVALGDNFAAYTGIAFKFVDANGTVLGDADLGATVPVNGNNMTIIDGAIMVDHDNDANTAEIDITAEADIKVTVVEAPADSAWLGEEIGLKYDGSVNKAWTLFGGSFDEEGKYTFKVALKNGKTATASVVVKDFGEPVAMKLIYVQDTIGLNAKQAVVKAVTLLDANYTAKTIYNNVQGYTTQRYDLEFVANGKALDNCANAGEGLFANTDGTITTKSVALADEDEYIGTKISAMVICDELELIATAELEVVATEEALKYVDKEAKIAENNELEVVLVDANGKAVDVAFDADDALKVYVLDAPKNAVYDVEGVVDEANGEMYVNFTTSAAGEYKLQTVLTYGPQNAEKYISVIETITVGGTVDTFKDVVVLSMGAKSMIVNDEIVALDVAPFVAEGRTMMQYTALKAFGIEFNWDGVDTVTAEGNGVKVVMTIGSKVATVNGKVVNMEVAPTIIDGRTVIPVTYATNPFGIVATALYDANGVSDVLFTAK